MAGFNIALLSFSACGLPPTGNIGVIEVLLWNGFEGSSWYVAQLRLDQVWSPLCATLIPMSWNPCSSCLHQASLWIMKPGLKWCRHMYDDLHAGARWLSWLWDPWGCRALVGLLVGCWFYWCYCWCPAKGFQANKNITPSGHRCQLSKTIQMINLPKTRNMEGFCDAEDLHPSFLAFASHRALDYTH